MPENYQYHHFEELESTQQVARQLYQQHGCVIVSTKTQTKGRGRAGKKWFSNEGSFLFSFSRALPFRDERLMFLSYALALSVREVFLADTNAPLPTPLYLKWPNDILIPSEKTWKKVGGLLCELDIQQQDVLFTAGIGLNLYPPAPSIPSTYSVTSQYEPSAIFKNPQRIKTEQLSQAICHRFDQWIDIIETRRHATLLETYASCCMTLGCDIQLSDGSKGYAEGLDPNGRLILRTHDGDREYKNSGEIILQKRIN